MPDDTSTLALFPLDDIVPAGLSPVVWSYGMGVESTAGIHLWITDPTSRPAELAEDLSNLIVLIAQTGDEWSSTISMVERYLLPELRAKRVRLVEVARAGPLKSDGVVVLQDSREPVRLHADADEHGFFSLSTENRRNGVMPQLGGQRKCSARAKGMPLDEWRAHELGSQPYLHAIGFNAQEGGRIAKDRSVTMGGRRRPIYPIAERGWSRQDCSTYLGRVFALPPGTHWPKSCCRQCCFAGGQEGWPDQLARFQLLPEEAAHHVVDEQVAIALNPNSGLFGPGKSLTDRLRRDGAGTVLQQASQHLDAVPWALYRVRRIYRRRGAAWRSVRVCLRGTRAAMSKAVLALAASLDLTACIDGDVTKVWLHERTQSQYPAVEEFYATTAAHVLEKERPTFENRWIGLAPDELLALESRAAAAFTDLTT